MRPATRMIDEALRKAGFTSDDPPPLDPSEIDAWEHRQAIRDAERVYQQLVNASRSHTKDEERALDEM